MSRLVALDNRIHRRLCVAPERIAAQGARLHMVPVVLSEFLKLCVQFPIVLTKNADTGRFVCVCLFGLAKNENMFWRNNQWDALYTPLQIARQPFFVGGGETAQPSRADGDFVLCIDAENDSLQQDTGERIFDEEGNETPYLQKAKAILAALLTGETETQRFIDKLLALKLVQPMRLEVEYANRQSQRVAGLYTVDEERMKSLASADLIELHSLHYLAPIYTMMASLGHVYSLVNRKNALLAG
jgi:hypothetical protein